MPSLKNKINKLLKEVARREGKKSQARIGDLREIFGILSDMVYEEDLKYCIDALTDFDEISRLLYENGERRSIDRSINGKKK